MKKIGIIGRGFVGSAVEFGFSAHLHRPPLELTEVTKVLKIVASPMTKSYIVLKGSEPASAVTTTEVIPLPDSVVCKTPVALFVLVPPLSSLARCDTRVIFFGADIVLESMVNVHIVLDTTKLCAVIFPTSLF